MPGKKWFQNKWLIPSAAAAIVVVCLLAGYWLFAFGLITLAACSFAGWMYWRTQAVGAIRVAATHSESAVAEAHDQPAEAFTPRAPVDPDSLVGEMLAQGRCALLLRAQIASNLRSDEIDRAMEALDKAMALVPEGQVLIDGVKPDDSNEPSQPAEANIVRVECVYLDRYPVTNRQFYQFVSHGGYQQMSLWDPSVWPAVLDFVDATGQPGPRFWKNGKFKPGEEDHAVVGVSWFEAAAFARWVGKRLPSDPEWVKAGSWPISATGHRPIQRKFPWGNTMDRTMANLWGSGPGATVSVYEFADGVSVGGIYQLIGNVWEWTSSNFGAWNPRARSLETGTPMKSIRGGAFDTYFDTQATCHFQSGDSPMARKHNIGFRCALSLCDVITELDEPVDEYVSAKSYDRHTLVSCGAEAEE